MGISKRDIEAMRESVLKTRNAYILIYERPAFLTQMDKLIKTAEVAPKQTGDLLMQYSVNKGYGDMTPIKIKPEEIRKDMLLKNDSLWH